MIQAGTPARGSGPSVLSTGVQILEPGTQPPTNYTSVDQLEPQYVIGMLASAGGNYRLAIERIQTETTLKISVSDLVDVIKDHLPELKRQMEAVATIELFSMLPAYRQVATQAIHNLEAKDAVGAYEGLMKLIQQTTKSNEINLNINDQRFAALPRSVQQAYAALEAAGALDTLDAIDTLDTD